MDHCGMGFKVYKCWMYNLVDFSRVSKHFDLVDSTIRLSSASSGHPLLGKGASLARPKVIAAVETALQRILTTEIVLSFIQGEPGVTKAV